MNRMNSTWIAGVRTGSAAAASPLVLTAAWTVRRTGWLPASADGRLGSALAMHVRRVRPALRAFRPLYGDWPHHELSRTRHAASVGVLWRQSPGSALLGVLAIRAVRAASAASLASASQPRRLTRPRRRACQAMPGSATPASQRRRQGAQARRPRATFRRSAPATTMLGAVASMFYVDVASGGSSADRSSDADAVLLPPMPVAMTRPLPARSAATRRVRN